MNIKGRFGEIVAWALLTALSIVSAMSYSSTRPQRLIHFVSYMAIFLATWYLPPLLSWVWRVIFFGMALGLAILLWVRQDSYFPFVVGTMFSFLAPARRASKITMREAWRYFRNAEQGEKEAAKAIITRHLKNVSRRPVS